MSEELNQDLVAQPTQAGQAAADEALVGIKNRSFSGRHPELGKMIKCAICKHRHRENPSCTQVFSSGERIKGIIVTYRRPNPVGDKTHKQVLGAAMFNRRRINRHLNWRQRMIVQVVQQNLPVDENNEYTKKDLIMTKRNAVFALAEKYGRHGFLPPLWQIQKDKREKAAAKSN